MASEPIYVGAPIHDEVVVDAVFVPDDKYRNSEGVWLLVFANGADRELRTKASYYLTARDFIGRGQYDAEGAVRFADIRRESEDALPRERLMPQRCRCETCRRW
jgi:hypothetical protein